jgi:hypothetical protein
MVPRKPEKRSPRDPVEGSEASGHGAAERKHEQDIVLEVVSTQFQWIASVVRFATQRSRDLRSRMR